MAVRVAVGVEVGVGMAVGVAVGVEVGVGMAAGVAVGVEVGVGMAVGVAVGVEVGVGMAVGVGVAGEHAASIMRSVSVMRAVVLKGRCSVRRMVGVSHTGGRDARKGARQQAAANWPGELPQCTEDPTKLDNIENLHLAVRS